MNIRARRILMPIIAGVLAAIVGSALWEYLAQPGLNSLWRLVLTVATLGSEAARDAAYNSAAMDPTSVPALLHVHMVIFGLALLSGGLAGALTSGAAMRRWQRRRSEMSAEHAADDDTSDDSRMPAPRWLRPARFISIAAVFAIVVSATVAAINVDQSVLIWRTFNNHVARCSPFLTDDEEEAIRSRFAHVESRSDYLELEAVLESIAARNGIELKDIELW